jgi:hypothetical protein
MVYYGRPPVNCSGGNMILSAEGPIEGPNFPSEQHSEKLGYYRHLYPWHGGGYPYGYGYGLGYGGCIAPSCYRGMCGRGGYPWYGGL